MARLRLRCNNPLLLLLASSSLAIESDFSFYPQNAQSCLNQASNTADCKGSTTAQLNTCLCSNQGGFITNTAKCVGQKDKDDVQKVYATMLQACNDSHTPMGVSQSDFLAAADGNAPSTTKTTASSTATSTTAKVTTTTTTTPAPTPTETGATGKDKDTHGGRLSTGATIGIAVGASVAGLAALAGLAFFVVRRKRRSQEEAHPMLSQHEYLHHQTPTTFPPSEPSADGSRFGGAELKAGWWSPGYAGPYAPTPVDNAMTEPPPDGAAHGHGVYEMEGSTVPLQAVEMQGSEPPAYHHMRQ
ncbi:Uncharacterized protein TCAP_04145 [Tolypocladium capitatum]|uniref:Extracellular membrane protein CFEM domain-containing protein n=1 Tax=Tolypocladium capitatum TaxID=45235 RepID=A0A2K3QEG1_9HYPO|nr:Uncharacterized protein TCAP_04145 [Tolypocladium capitatum]